MLLGFRGMEQPGGHRDVRQEKRMSPSLCDLLARKSVYVSKANARSDTEH